MSDVKRDSVTIGCVNYQSVWGDVGANLRKMQNIVAQAAQAGINLLAFPELALSGYECGGAPCMHAAAAQTIPGPATAAMAEAAAKHDMYVVFGMPERSADNPDVRHITSVVVGPHGLVGRYRKLHLARPPVFTETLCFTPGRELPVFETPYGLIGIQICFDFWVFPELTRILVLKGAEIVINTSGSGSGAGKEFFLTAMTAARAAENRICVATANMAGKERRLSYYGHSAIAAAAPPAWLRVYAQAGAGEEVVSATVNLEALRRWRARSDWQNARRGEVILEELERLAKRHSRAAKD